MAKLGASGKKKKKRLKKKFKKKFLKSEKVNIPTPSDYHSVFATFVLEWDSRFILFFTPDNFALPFTNSV